MDEWMHKWINKLWINESMIVMNTQQVNEGMNEWKKMVI